MHFLVIFLFIISLIGCGEIFGDDSDNENSKNPDDSGSFPSVFENPIHEIQNITRNSSVSSDNFFKRVYLAEGHAVIANNENYSLYSLTENKLNLEFKGSLEGGKPLGFVADRIITIISGKSEFTLQEFRPSEGKWKNTVNLTGIGGVATDQSRILGTSEKQIALALTHDEWGETKEHVSEVIVFSGGVGQWKESTRLSPPASMEPGLRFGCAVGLSEERIAVGVCPKTVIIDGQSKSEPPYWQVAMYQQQDGKWTLSQIIKSTKELWHMFSMEIALHGDQMMVGSNYDSFSKKQSDMERDPKIDSESGLIHSFTQISDNWELTQIIENEGYFDFGIDLSFDGVTLLTKASKTIVVGGDVYMPSGILVYKRSAEKWDIKGTLVPSEQGAWSASTTHSLFGSYTLVGDSQITVKGSEANSEAGAAFLFEIPQ